MSGPDRIKAWLKGWDDGLVGRPSLPYKKRPQICNWQAGYQAARRSSAYDIWEMKRRVNRKKPGTYPEETAPPLPHS